MIDPPGKVRRNERLSMMKHVLKRREYPSAENMCEAMVWGEKRCGRGATRGALLWAAREGDDPSCTLAARCTQILPRLPTMASSEVQGRSLGNLYNKEHEENHLNYSTLFQEPLTHRNRSRTSGLPKYDKTRGIGADLCVPWSLGGDHREASQPCPRRLNRSLGCLRRHSNSNARSPSACLDKTRSHTNSIHSNLQVLDGAPSCNSCTHRRIGTNPPASFLRCETRIPGTSAQMSEWSPQMAFHILGACVRSVGSQLDPPEIIRVDGQPRFLT